MIIVFSMYVGRFSRADVALEQSIYEVSASDGEVEVCAVLSGNLSRFEWRIGSLQTFPANSAIVRGRLLLFFVPSYNVIFKTTK